MKSARIKTSLEIERLRLAAEALERVLADLATIIRPGIVTRDIEHVAEIALTRHGLEGVLGGYRGYPSLVCTSVNNVAAHGLPGEAELRRGDIVTVDISASRSGWMADAAWSYAVGRQKPENRRLLRAAWRSTLAGAAAARPGSRIGDIGAAIETESRKHGCRVIPQFTGHGIGRELHEEPSLPHSSEPDLGSRITSGMVFNVEPVLTLGTPAAHQIDDGWSYVTADGAVAAQFEVTVAVLESGPVILTLGRYPDLPRQPPYGFSSNTSIATSRDRG